MGLWRVYETIKVGKHQSRQSGANTVPKRYFIFIWKWLIVKMTWNFSKWPGDGAFRSHKIPTYFSVRRIKKKKSIRTSASPHTSSLFCCSCCVCVWVLRESEWGEKVRWWFMQIYAHKLLQTIWCCVPAKEHEEHESGRAARVGVCVPLTYVLITYSCSAYTYGDSQSICCFIFLFLLSNIDKSNFVH